MKMVVSLCDNIIRRTKVYDLDEMYQAIDDVFTACHLTNKKKDPDGGYVYFGNDDTQDLARFFRAINALRAGKWFMDACQMWRFYSDDDAPDEYEDCLMYYKKKGNKICRKLRHSILILILKN